MTRFHSLSAAARAPQTSVPPVEERLVYKDNSMANKVLQRQNGYHDALDSMDAMRAIVAAASPQLLRGEGALLALSGGLRAATPRMGTSDMGKSAERIHPEYVVGWRYACQQELRLRCSYSLLKGTSDYQVRAHKNMPSYLLYGLHLLGELIMGTPRWLPSEDNNPHM